MQAAASEKMLATAENLVKHFDSAKEKLETLEEFHFQEDYFNRLIKTQTGLTYTEYLQLLRLRRAETLLLTTDATIDQITEAVGYHNKGYFYKIFTERHQLTPAQFRKKM